jgi:hypothetical protein
MKPSKHQNAAPSILKAALFLLAATLVACGESAPPKVDLKVGNWGPQTTAAKTVPNPQPDGGAGIWIEVSDTQGLGDAQVLFGGEPAKITVVQSKLITASVAPQNFAQPGSKEVAIKQVSTGKVFPVGTFKVELAK